MLDYVKKVRDQEVPEGKVAVFWLGQAGFLIKTDLGTLCYVDPYFSNCCERHFGFRRLMPAVIGKQHHKAIFGHGTGDALYAIKAAVDR